MICIVLLLGLSIIASIAMPTEDIVPETEFQEQELLQEATGCRTSWGNKCEGGCLKRCAGKKRNKNKMCCNKKIGHAQCHKEKGTYCLKLQKPTHAIAKGPCHGKRTSWGKHCSKGCFRPCGGKKNRRNKTKWCCNKRSSKEACSRAEGTFCG